MVSHENHKLIKLGWTDGNFWDSVFDSTASQEPTVENNEKTDGDLFFSEILNQDNDN